jgi:hypothetical protein
LLDQPVGKGRLPMIYVGDYRKVADEREFSHAAAPSRAAPPLQAWRKGGRGVGAMACAMGVCVGKWFLKSIGLRGEQRFYPLDFLSKLKTQLVPLNSV